jgi:voltage-gated potassium channel
VETPGARLPSVKLPESTRSPRGVLALRFLIATSLVLVIAMLAWLDRGGYSDAGDGELNFLDALYYSTVTITTTGYGDIAPVSESARLVTTFVTTPLRILFLVLLVGTTVELLTSRSVTAVRERLWRQRVHDHTIVCGYGNTGRASAERLVEAGHPKDQVVVVDRDSAFIADAARNGFAGVRGDATLTQTLDEAGIDHARSVLVAVSSDATAALISLTARELNPKATIVAAIMEDENAHLLVQSGANGVVRGPTATGRLLAAGSDAPHLLTLVEDLLDTPGGLHVIERLPSGGEGYPEGERRPPDSILGVIRGEEVLRYDDPRAADRQEGDKLICLGPHEAPDRADGN